MATVAELIEQGNNLVDDEFDNKKWVDWFNTCLLFDLAGVIDVTARAELTRADGAATTPFVLPDDYNKDMIILTSEVTEYSVIGGNIYVDSGYTGTTLDFVYNRDPAPLSTSAVTAEPEFPSRFHPILAYYGAMTAMLSDDETERYALMEKEYRKLRGLMVDYYAKRKSFNSPSKWEVIR